MHDLVNRHVAVVQNALADIPRQIGWLAGRSFADHECVGQILGRIGTSRRRIAHPVLEHDASHTGIGSAFAIILPALHCGEDGRWVVWRPAARFRAVEWE